jgi:hypothetical protein
MLTLQAISTTTHRPFPVIFHEGRHWIAAEEGQEYAIEVHNASAERAEVVLSVDGLSVMTGEAGRKSDRGYIVAPWDTLRVTGWRRDDHEVAAFRFSATGESYGAKAGKGTENCGVIGMACWAERMTPQVQTVRERVPYFPVSIPVVPYFPVPVWPHRSNWPWWEPQIWCTTNTSHDVQLSTPPQRTIKSAILRSHVQPTEGAVAEEAPSFDLGTGYGRALESNVHKTSFERAASSPFHCDTLHYASREALERMGVPVPKAAETPRMPTAWPGCVAPAGWSRTG